MVSFKSPCSLPRSMPMRDLAADIVVAEAPGFMPRRKLSSSSESASDVIGNTLVFIFMNSDKNITNDASYILKFINKHQGFFNVHWDVDKGCNDIAPAAYSI